MNEDHYEDFESGPFCQHWGDPGDCDEKCKRCGHECHEHDSISDSHYCEAEGCDCEGFVNEGDGDD